MLHILQRLFSRHAPTKQVEQGPLFREVQDIMVEVRAYARTHGGDIELVSVTEEGVVSIRLRGACKGCPVSFFTIRYGIEERLRILVPGVTKIVQLKD